MNELTDEYLLSYEQDLDKAFNRLLDEYVLIRIGRANPRVLDKIMVDYYGTRTPINQTGNITIPEARMMIVSPWDPSTIKPIKTAIETANLGVSISDDGKIIRIIFPMLTEERRKEFSKVAKKLLEDSKIAMRNARRDVLDVLKTMKKNSEISEDELESLEKDVQKMLDSYTAKADINCEKKITEIMEV